MCILNDESFFFVEQVNTILSLINLVLSGDRYNNSRIYGEYLTCKIYLSPPPSPFPHSPKVASAAELDIAKVVGGLS